MSFIIKLLFFYLSLFVISSSVNQYLSKKYRFQEKYLPKISWGILVYFIIYMISLKLEIFIWQVHLALTAVTVLSVYYFVVKYAVYGSIFKWKSLLTIGSSQKVLLITSFILAMMMVLQGVYLEFPSDPVHHLLYIQNWSTALQFGTESSYGDYKKITFAYFINHWLLQNSGLAEGSYWEIDLLTGLFTGLFFYQILKFISTWIPYQSLTLLGGFSSLLLFGVSDFSFYRYYTLAPVFYAYLVFLEILILLIISILKNQYKYLAFTPLLIWFTWQNHQQETLFILIATSALIAIQTLFFKKRTTLSFYSLNSFLFYLGLLGLFIFLLFNKDLIFQREDYQSLFHYFSIGNYIFEWFKPAISYDVLGILGIALSIGTSFFLFKKNIPRKYVIMFGLCITPFLILYFPLSIEILKIPIGNPFNYYRIFYGVPYWILPSLFAIFLFLNLQKYGIFRNQYWIRKYFIFLCFLMLFIPFTFPESKAFGRLRHLFFPYPEANGKELTEVIQYLNQNAGTECTDPFYVKTSEAPKNTNQNLRSYVMTDSYIGQSLSFTGYFYPFLIRQNQSYYFLDNVEPSQLKANDSTANWKWLMNTNPTKENAQQFVSLLKKIEICYLVVSTQTEFPISQLGKKTNHWRAEARKDSSYFSLKWLKWIHLTPESFTLVFDSPPFQIYQIK